MLHPVAFAGWIGLLVTALNLIPVGQLDGGHVAYALLARITGRFPWAAFGLLVCGLVVWHGWLVWAVLLLSGLAPSAALRVWVPLDHRRRVLAPSPSWCSY